MEMRHLELLRELSARGTLAAVAAATHRTPSALSQQLRTAEREFGVPLVEPVSRGLRLTPAGQVLADGADAVCTAAAQLQARLDATIRSPRGVVSIGSLPSAATFLLPGLVRRLAGSEITIEPDDFDLAEVDYAARTLDLDLVIAHSLTGDRPAGSDGLVSTLLCREPIDVAIPVGHPLAGAACPLQPADLSGTTWIGVPPGYPFDTILIAVEHLIGEMLPRRVRLRDNRLIEALLPTGADLALLPRYTTPPDAELVLRPLAGVHCHRSVVALSRPDRAARLAVRTVLDLLVEVGHTIERP